MRTNNPVLKRIFNSVDHEYTSYMTIEGTIAKTAICFVLMLIAAGANWYLFTINSPIFIINMIGGTIVGLILALVTIFKQDLASKTVPLYAICQGLSVGGISVFAAQNYSGIIVPVLGLTLGTFGTMLLLYKLSIIKVTENFKMAVIAATGGIFFMYLLSFILSLLGVQISVLQNGTIGIIISLIAVAVAAFNLALDFDFIYEASELKLPKSMEWYGAFSLVVTIIWLYIEILRLVMKLSKNRD